MPTLSTLTGDRHSASPCSGLPSALDAAPAILEHERNLDVVHATLRAEFPLLAAFERDAVGIAQVLPVQAL
jgi:hypothetical protein